MNREQLISQSWFQELQQDVQQELNRLSEQPDFSTAAFATEAKQLQTQQQGWTLSLGNPNLPPETRRLIEQQVQIAADRVNEIESLQTQKQAQSQRQTLLVDPDAVVKRLDRLDEVLAAHNPSLTNIELSAHIDRIDCFPEGRVVLRTCRLGVLADAVDLFSEDEKPIPNDDSGTPHTQKVQPRRRARRRITCGDQPSEELKALAAWSTDPHRFASLNKRWFEEHEFQVPLPTGWYQDHAMEVAAKRAEGLSHQELVEYFGRTVPTIRKALRHAFTLDPSLEHLKAKRQRRRWHEDHVPEVVNLISRDWKVPRIARHFGKSETTIHKAVEHAKEVGLLADEDAL